MAATTTAALFVTANVGSIFEDPSSMLKIWTEEFLATVSHSSPKMVALHCQEVGGKNYERSMQHVSDFVKLLMESEELRPFNKVRIYLDEDYSSAEHFTALGNFYFFHESIPDENVQIYDFQERKFVPVTDKEIHSGNIEAVSTKEKSKFPQEIFPECKWSRKGFMRTRWNLNGTVFDLVNIHLFHDASNFIAMESFPSVYCKNRQRALEHTLKRFHTDQYGIVPFFVFGDFNFRTDTQGVVKKLSEGLNAVRVQSNKNTDHTKLQYKDESSQVVLTLGKKEFSHQNHQKVFVGEESDWLKEFDRELDSFSGQLFEFTINFPPTYPYVEDSESGEMYMQTRCPSWCDRVFLSASAQALVKNIGEDTCAQYGLIGQNACMGDHKPVFLQAELVGGLGTVSCCVLPAAPCTSCLCAASPVVHYCRLCSEQPVERSSFSLFEEQEQDHNGLMVPAFHLHTSPYTPDSTDTEPDLLEEAVVQNSVKEMEKEQKLYSMSALQKRSVLPNASTLQTAAHNEGQNLRRSSSGRKSASKIPIHIRDTSREEPLTAVSPVSKIPVLKCKSLSPDAEEKSQHVKKAILASQSVSPGSVVDHLHTRIPVSAQHSSKSFILKPRAGESRKVIRRQKSVDGKSSDSDCASMEESGSVEREQERITNAEGNTKVEIHLSLVQPPEEPLSPIESESNMLLNIDTLVPGGSATDSGVSVSPDLSGATSPSTDGVDKMIGSVHDPGECDGGDGRPEEETVTTPISLERFSLVRRIQSASAMERKSSFPMPSSVLAESEMPLGDIGGSGSNLWGMRTCRCMSDSSWRQRSSTVSHMMLRSRTDSRIRLISTSSNLDMSLPRLQSHHSSSEEDWFEEVVDDNENDGDDDGDDEDDDDDEGVEVKRKVENYLNETGSKLVNSRITTEQKKRLSTHEEDVIIKASDSNVSDVNEAVTVEEKGLLPICCEATPQAHHPSESSMESARAIVSIGKTLAQTCFVDTERKSRGEDLTLPNLEYPPKKASPEEGSEDIVCADVPRIRNLTDSVMTSSQEQNQGATSANAKEQNKGKCKACCVLL